MNTLARLEQLRSEYQRKFEVAQGRADAWENAMDMLADAMAEIQDADRANYDLAEEVAKATERHLDEHRQRMDGKPEDDTAEQHIAAHKTLLVNSRQMGMTAARAEAMKEFLSTGKKPGCTHAKINTCPECTPASLAQYRGDTRSIAPGLEAILNVSHTDSLLVGSKVLKRSSEGAIEGELRICRLLPLASHAFASIVVKNESGSVITITSGGDLATDSVSQRTKDWLEGKEPAPSGTVALEYKFGVGDVIQMHGEKWEVTAISPEYYTLQMGVCGQRTPIDHVDEKATLIRRAGEGEKQADKPYAHGMKFREGDNIIFKGETWKVARLGFMQYELHRDNYIRIADSHDVDRDAKPAQEEPLKMGDWVQLVGEPTWCGTIVCEGPPVPSDKDDSAFIELDFANGPGLVTATDGDEVTAHGWMLHRSCLRRVSPPAKKEATQ